MPKGIILEIFLLVKGDSIFENYGCQKYVNHDEKTLFVSAESPFSGFFHKAFYPFKSKFISPLRQKAKGSCLGFCLNDFMFFRKNGINIWQRWRKKSFPICLKSFPACLNFLLVCLNFLPACLNFLPTCLKSFPACLNFLPVCLKPFPVCLNS